VSKIRIGAWQGPTVDNNPEKNIQKVIEVLERTQSLGLDFLCFPEVFLARAEKISDLESCLGLDDPRITHLLEVSAKFDTVLIVGMNERDQGQILNTCLVIHAGRLLGKYHKTILTHEELPYTSTDLDMPVFDAKGIRFGVVLCHDTSFVEPALCLRWKGARLLFTPHYNDIPPEGIDTSIGKVTFWQHRRMVLNNQAALATLLKMVVVRSNVIIVKPDHLGAGDCGIWNMDGVAVAEGTPFVEQVVTCEFDQEIFKNEYWIDRHEVPPALLDQIARAAHDYPPSDIITGREQKK
jgi:predicted amidohydrolase